MTGTVLSSPPEEKPAPPVVPPRKGWLQALPFLLAGCLFWALYFALGRQLAAHDMLHNNVMFHSDSDRVVTDMCVFGLDHRRTNVHPLFVLFENPFGVPLAQWLGSPTQAALVLNSLTGGLCIAAAGWFFFSFGLPVVRALLLSFLLGCSTAHLFFGSSPETFSLSALSIIVLFYLVHRRPGDLRTFVPAGLFSFGVLLTNIAPAALTYGSSLLASLKLGRTWLWRMTLYVTAVVVLAAGLAFVQKLIWPHSELFFAPKAYVGESRFFSPAKDWEHRQARELMLFYYRGVYDWFAPGLLHAPDGRTGLAVSFDHKNWHHLGRLGRVTLRLWFVFLGLGVAAFLRYRLWAAPVPRGLLLVFGFNLVLHTFYGDDLFLYACNSDFVLLALAAVSIHEFRLTNWRAHLLDAGLVALLALEITINWRFVQGLLALTRSMA